MDDDERDQMVVSLLLSLLDSPAQGWKKTEVDDMRLNVECGEYGDPFENLIALGLASKQGFDASQLGKIDALIALMDLESSPWVCKLRHYQRNNEVAPGGDHKPVNGRGSSAPD